MLKGEGYYPPPLSVYAPVCGINPFIAFECGLYALVSPPTGLEQVLRIRAPVEPDPAL